MERRRTTARPAGPLRWAPAWLDALPAVTPPVQHDGNGHLQDVIEQLPATQLVVINGIYWERISQARLARRLGVSQQAVGRRHARALARIRRTLDHGGSP